MQIGIVGLGRMGANIARRLMQHGHEAVVFDRNEPAVAGLAGEGANGAASLAEIVAKLTAPRAVWVMLPAGSPTEQTIEALAGLLAPGRHRSSTAATPSTRTTSAARRPLAAKGLHYVDVGTSGGVWGLERGYCMMIGGPDEAVDPSRPDLRRAGAGPGHHPAHARAATAPIRAPRKAISTPARRARAISSRWSTTASSMA